MALLTKFNGEPYKYQKIFGIGLGKTGTTTLTVALEDLGYHKSIHFPLNEMDLVFEGYYDSATDTPVAYEYEALLKRFPDAGFILTVRDTESWMKSIEAHMTTGGGSDGLRYGDICELRKNLYGSERFDSILYEKAYKNHTINVLQLFLETNNLDRLLVYPLIETPGWDTLCAFLELTEPNLPFPHLNKGAYSKR